MRTPNPKSDFVVTVEGIGDFTFGRRTFGDKIDILREHSRILGGVTASPFFDLIATWIAELKVLAVHVPDGWKNLDALLVDGDDDSLFEKLGRVNRALLEKERSFRQGSTS